MPLRLVAALFSALLAACSGRIEHHFAERDGASDASSSASDGRAPSDASTMEGAPGADISEEMRSDISLRPDAMADAVPPDSPRSDVSSDAPTLDGPLPDGSSAPDASLPDGSNPPDAPHDTVSDRDVMSDAPQDAPPDACTDPAACTPGPLRLLAPHSTGLVTSLRPTFKWTAALQAASYRVEVCGNVQCNSPLTTISTTATSAQPATALPWGNHYWRVVALNGEFSTSSSIWEFSVGALSEAVDTSWLGPPDFNRDLSRDVAIGALNQVHLLVTPSQGAPPPNQPNQTLNGSNGFGSTISYAGDVNGDGRGDLIVSSLQNDYARLFLGTATGLATNPQSLGSGTSTMRQYVAGLGDVNGDGYADIAVGEGTSTFEWRIYKGSDTGAVPSGEVLGACPDAIDLEGDGIIDGCPAGGAGDVNGDGFADVIMCSRSAKTATVYLRNAAGTAATQVIPMPGGETTFGDACIGAGDVNGDGYADVLVSTWGATSVYVYFGSPSGITMINALAVTGSTPGGGVITSIAAAGDVNGDGYGDIVVGAYGINRVLVYHGSAGGPLTLATEFATLPDGGAFGQSVAGTGDLNGDGYGDIAFGPGRCTGYNVYAYPGSASGVGNGAPLTQWSPPSGASCFGVIAR